MGNTRHSNTDQNQDASHSETREAKMEAIKNTNHGRWKATMEAGQEEMKTIINSTLKCCAFKTFTFMSTS
jgi:hypothetical protein